MPEWIDALLKRPAVAHIVRAVSRFTERNGPIMAAAVTYFSVLSLVPVLMFLFAMTGLVVTSLLPGLLDSIRASILGAVGEGSFQSAVESLIDTYLGSFGWAAVTALVFALWSGTGWLGNLKIAVRTQLNDDIVVEEKHNFIVAMLIDMGNFLLLIFMTIVTFATTIVATSLNRTMLGWLGLTGRPGIGALVGILGLLLSIFAATVLFLYLFWALAGDKLPRREWLLGSLMAGAGLMILQSLAGFITGMFSGNVSAQVFGPLIVVMLFLNLYATLIMFAAAWIGTAGEADSVEVEGEAAKDQGETPVAMLGPIPTRATGRLIGENPTLDDVPRPDPNILIPQDVAARGVRVGASVGWGLGAAAGLGIGTLIASLAKGLIGPRAPKN